MEAQARFFAAQVTQIRQSHFGQRATCPLCGDTPQDERSGFAWPEGLSRHLEGRGNVHPCPVIEIAFAACRKARTESRQTPEKIAGPSKCHPELPAYKYGQGECKKCYDAELQNWHKGIDDEVAKWVGLLCGQSGHSWSPAECLRCKATRCKARYSDGQRCRNATPCAVHPAPAPTIVEWPRQ